MSQKTLYSILAAAAILVVFTVLYRFQRENRATAILKSEIPSYFQTASEAELVSLDKKDGQFALRSSETLEFGLTTEVNQPFQSVLNEYYKKIRANNWALVGGSKQENGKAVFKISNSSQTFFLIIEDFSPMTKITIIPVKK